MSFIGPQDILIDILAIGTVVLIAAPSIQGKGPRAMVRARQSLA